jgi:hypothetical protein
MWVVKEGGDWRIAGAGAEEAALAFAQQIDGRLTYKLADPHGCRVSASY